MLYLFNFVCSGITIQSAIKSFVRFSTHSVFILSKGLTSGRRCGYIPDRIQLEENSIGGKLLAFMHGPCCGYSHSSLDINVLRPGTIHRKIINKYTVALCHLKWALKSANPLILEQPLKRTIEDNLFLLFFLSGWTKNKWIRTFQWQMANVYRPRQSQSRPRQ